METIRRQNKTLIPDFERDIKEWYIRERMPEVLDVLLIDRTTGKNIMWGTKDYESRGKGFGEWDEIKADLIANISNIMSYATMTTSLGMMGVSIANMLK